MTYVDGTETRFFTDVNGDLHIEPTGNDTYIEGQCITGDSLLPIVDVEKGNHKDYPYNSELKQIKDVKAGDYVLSLNQETNKIEPHRIKGLLDMGVRPVYRLTTESGKTIRTTGNHPYLAKTNQKTADLAALWCGGQKSRTPFDKNRIDGLSILGRNLATIPSDATPQFDYNLLSETTQTQQKNNSCEEVANDSIHRDGARIDNRLNYTKPRDIVKAQW